MHNKLFYTASDVSFVFAVFLSKTNANRHFWNSDVRIWLDMPGFNTTH